MLKIRRSRKAGQQPNPKEQLKLRLLKERYPFALRTVRDGEEAYTKVAHGLAAKPKHYATEVNLKKGDRLLKYRFWDKNGREVKPQWDTRFSHEEILDLTREPHGDWMSEAYGEMYLTRRPSNGQAPRLPAFVVKRTEAKGRKAVFIFDKDGDLVYYGPQHPDEGQKMREARSRMNTAEREAGEVEEAEALEKRTKKT